MSDALAVPTDSAAAPASNAIANVFIIPPQGNRNCPRHGKCRRTVSFPAESSNREKLCGTKAPLAELDRLVGFGGAVVVVLDAAAVDDRVAVDGEAIGLGAERLAHHRIEIGPDASGPVHAGGLAARRGDTH